MIFLKTQHEIASIKASCDILGRALGEVAKAIEPGVTTLELDRIAETVIRDYKAIPSFLGYQGFPATLCTSVNDEVVHGIPSKRILVDGDVVSVDCGVFLNGFHGDSAYTFTVGEVSSEIQKLLDSTKKSLYLGIEQAVNAKRIGDIGFAIQSHNEANGYSVVREMVGHGIGRSLHEDPQVPNYGRKGSGTKLKTGMVLAIEPMINLGTKSIVIEKDGWTIRTKDHKVSAHFEHTVLVQENFSEILSTFDYIEKR